LIKARSPDSDFFAQKKSLSGDLFYYILSMKKDSFWGRVKVLLNAHNMSQKQFAEVTGFSLGTIRGWIYHNRVPELSAAYAVAYALGVSLEYLLGGKEKEITELRFRELEMRKTAARITRLLYEAQLELKQMRPLAGKN